MTSIHDYYVISVTFYCLVKIILKLRRKEWHGLGVCMLRGVGVAKEGGCYRSLTSIPTRDVHKRICEQVYMYDLVERKIYPAIRVYMAYYMWGKMISSTVRVSVYMLYFVWRKFVSSALRVTDSVFMNYFVLRKVVSPALKVSVNWPMSRVLGRGSQVTRRSGDDLDEVVLPMIIYDTLPKHVRIAESSFI